MTWTAFVWYGTAMPSGGIAIDHRGRQIVAGRIIVRGGR